MRVLLLTLLLTGCGDAVWTPAVDLAWSAPGDRVAEDRVEDGCEVVFSEALLGVPSAALLDADGEVGLTRGAQAFDLLAGPATLGEVRVPAQAAFTSVRWTLGPPGEGTGDAGEGTATPAQRERTQALSVDVLATCGDDSVAFSLGLDAAVVTCALPDSLEVDAQASFPALLEVDPAAWMPQEDGAVSASALLAGDADGSGDLSPAEALATLRPPVDPFRNGAGAACERHD